MAAMLGAATLLVVAGGFCLRRGRRLGRRAAKEAAGWTALGLLVLAIGLVSMLGIDTLVAQTSRVVLHSLGWYGERRYIQELLIVLLLPAVAAGGLVAQARWRGASVALRVALATTVCVVALGAVWAISLHDSDAVLGRRVGGQPAGAIFGEACALVLLLAALWKETPGNDGE